MRIRVKWTGDVLNVEPDSVAEHLIASGDAERIDASMETTALEAPPERAVRPAPRRKKRS